MLTLHTDERPSLDGLTVWCETRLADGSVLAGTANARLFHEGEPVASFDAIPTRDRWYTPWGAPPDVRSLTVTPEGTVLVNVHVGGVWRATSLEGPWAEVVAVDDDTHQVLAGPPGSGLVVIAAAVGFGWSHDDGATWSWTTAGLHAAYCRAVGVSDRHVFVTASDGPFTKDGRLYRRPLASAADEPFTECGGTPGGLPERFPFNLDTFQLAASGAAVALATKRGDVFVSADEGNTWTLDRSGLAPVRFVGFAA